MAQSYAVLTNGTSAASFADGAGGATWFKIESNWIPRVANLRASQLGGRGPYEDVDETIPISIGGSNAAHMYANLNMLQSILVDANRWYNGEAVSAASFLYSPTHATISSAASPLQAAVWNTGLELSEDFDLYNGASGARAWMMGAQLRFRRNGLWLHTSSSASSASTTNGDTASVTMANTLTYKSPTKVSLTNFGHGKSTGSWYQGAYILIAENSSDILVYNAESLASGAWTSVSGSALSARNSNVLRYTPTGTTETFTAGGASPSFSTTSRITGIFANISNSTTTAFKFRVRLDSDVVGVNYTPWISVTPTAASFCGWVFCGTVPQNGQISNIYVSAIAASASSSFDIDTIVLFDMTKVQALEILGPSYAEANTTSVTDTLTIDHEQIEKPSPTAVVGTRALGYSGNAVISTTAASLTCLLLGTGRGDVASPRWRQYGGALNSNTWTLTRYTGYLTPV